MKNPNCCAHEWPDVCEEIELLICPLCLEEKPCPGCADCHEIAVVNKALRDDPAFRERFERDNPGLFERREQVMREFADLHRQVMREIYG